VFVADITDEKMPVGVATFNVPENHPDSKGGFCSRGGRFGAHSSNENQPPMYARQYIFVTWFNAGVRAIDIRDPYHPREAATTFPPRPTKTDKRCVKTPRESAARWRSSRTTSTWTTAASSTSSTAPTPACTSCSSTGARHGPPTSRAARRSSPAPAWASAARIATTLAEEGVRLAVMARRRNLLEELRRRSARSS
jgi:hypothetical protein